MTEVCPAGAPWRQSFPGPITSVATCGANGYAITLTSGQVDSNNDFGNFQSASKSGLKFLDINANGVRDPDGVDNIAGNADDEVGLAGFTINLTGTDGSGNVVNLNATTDANGNYSFSVAPGIYTVTEVCPAGAGWRQSFPGPITSVATCGANGYAITLTSGQVDANNDFGNFRHRVIVIGMGKSPRTPQIVTVIDEVTGDVLAQFAPYGNTFQGGVRVATGDLTGDGVDEIVTAPGWSIVAEVRVYTQEGVLLTSFQPYGSTFNGGVQVAVADVDGDGLNDIITVPSWGPAEVKVFQNVLVGGVPTFDAIGSLPGFPRVPSVVYRRRGGCRGRHGKHPADQRTVRHHAAGLSRRKSSSGAAPACRPP